MKEISDETVLDACRAFNVLVVEDNKTLLMQYSLVLEDFFGSVTTAADGKIGLDVFHEGHFDLVISDHFMPEMNGIDMIQAIRSSDRKTPIMLATSADDKHILIDAINLNISHFLLKPWNNESLRSSIINSMRAYVTEQLLSQEIEQHVQLLEKQKAYVVAQQERAFEKEYQAIRNDYYYQFICNKKDENDIWFLDGIYNPHDILSGDAYSVRRIDDATTFIFIADAMGKGISAAVTTISSASFINYYIDRLGEDETFEMRKIIDAYIAFIKENLLHDEIISVTFACFDQQEQSVEIAAFGMPPVLIHTIEDDVEKIRSNNPPISSFTGDFILDRHSFSTAKKILLCSDGLTESSLPDGSLYMQYLKEDFKRSHNRRSFTENFYERTAKKRDDDVTVLYFHHECIAADKLRRTVIPSLSTEIDPQCDRFHAFLVEHHVDTTLGIQLLLAFNELLLNAYEHGSLGISGSEKQQLLEQDLFLQECQKREPQNAHKRIFIDYAIDSSKLFVRIRDEGDGFDTKVLKKHLFQNSGYHGRGIKMSIKTTDGLYYSEKANCVILHKNLSKECCEN